MELQASVVEFSSPSFFHDLPEAGKLGGQLLSPFSLVRGYF